MTIYILVDVHYDHYRFEENLFASTDFGKILEFANNDKRYEGKRLFQYDKKDIHGYEGVEPEDEAHLWVQTFKS